MPAIDESTARTIGYATGHSRFERIEYDAKAMAQRNLSGRTHYADDGTLRFFHARINHCQTAHHGLVLILVESVAKDPRNTSRETRFVAFDMWGEVLNDRDATPRASTAKAREDATAWLETFDVLGHYRDAFTERAAQLERQAADYRAAAGDIPHTAPATA
jgi:hypothetical protein